MSEERSEVFDPTSIYGIERHDGRLYGKSYTAIANLFECATGTVTKYCAAKGSPPKEPQRGWDLLLLREFIVENFNPNHRLRQSMNQVLGFNPLDGIDSSKATDPSGPAAPSYKQRLDRAKAEKAELELAAMHGEIIHVSIFEKFFDETIPALVTDLRRQLESVCPALQEGLPADEIRDIQRKHLDRVFDSLQKRAVEFKESLRDSDVLDSSAKEVRKDGRTKR